MCVCRTYVRSRYQRKREKETYPHNSYFILHIISLWTGLVVRRNRHWQILILSRLSRKKAKRQKGQGIPIPQKERRGRFMSIIAVYWQSGNETWLTKAMDVEREREGCCCCCYSSCTIPETMRDIPSCRNRCIVNYFFFSFSYFYSSPLPMYCTTFMAGTSVSWLCEDVRDGTFPGYIRRDYGGTAILFSTLNLVCVPSIPLFCFYFCCLSISLLLKLVRADSFDMTMTSAIGEMSWRPCTN